MVYISQSAYEQDTRRCSLVRSGSLPNVPTVHEGAANSGTKVDEWLEPRRPPLGVLMTDPERVLGLARVTFLSHRQPPHLATVIAILNFFNT